VATAKYVFAEVNPAQCIKAYDRWGEYLDTDCRNNLPVIDGRKVRVVDNRYSASFAAGDGFKTVEVYFVLCSHAGKRRES